jgi:CRISPR-associated protein Cas1
MMKANELVQYLVGRHKTLDFSKPSLVLKREDDFDLRQKIISIPYSKAKQLGFSKGTLWYMKQNAKSDKPFKVYGKVREKLLL